MTSNPITDLRDLAVDLAERAGKLGPHTDLGQEMVTDVLASVEERFGLVSRMERADQLSRSAGRLRTLCQADLFYMCTKILSETGEMAGAIEDYFGRYDRPDKKSGSREKVIEEWGDAVVMFLRVAKMFDIDPALAIDQSLDKYEGRLKAIEEQHRAAAEHR